MIGSIHAFSCEVWRTLATPYSHIHENLHAIRQRSGEGPHIHQSSSEGASVYRWPSECAQETVALVPKIGEEVWAKLALKHPNRLSKDIESKPVLELCFK